GSVVADCDVTDPGPLAGGDRSERIREELTADQRPLLPVEVTHQSHQAAPVEPAEIIGVRLPHATGPVQVIEGMPDLMAHHIRGRGGPRANDDLAFAVGARA